jgi:RNA polymerase-binding transcription factor DksA
MSQEDRAQDQELFQWKLLNELRAPSSPEFKPDDSGYGPEFCRNEDCGEPLPELRRRMGKTLCTECQGLAERRQRRA